MTEPQIGPAPQEELEDQTEPAPSRGPARKADPAIPTQTQTKPIDPVDPIDPDPDRKEDHQKKKQKKDRLDKFTWFLILASGIAAALIFVFV